jgi:hypothetical protein
MQNSVSIYEHQTWAKPVLAAVQGQAALLLHYDVPNYYLSRELLAAALRTELPDNMVFAPIPFPYDALAFRLPKGTVRHPTDGDCPFLVLSRTAKEMGRFGHYRSKLALDRIEKSAQRYHGRNRRLIKARCNLIRHWVDLGVFLRN